MKNTYLLIGVAVVVLVMVMCLFFWKGSSGGDDTSDPAEMELVDDDLDAASPPSQKNTARPAIVLYHAEWCGHCKALRPVWDQFAAEAQKHIDVLDFEHSSMPGNGGDDIDGFPTVRYYPRGYPSEEYTTYSGDRSFESLVRFAQSGGQNV